MLGRIIWGKGGGYTYLQRSFACIFLNIIMIGYYLYNAEPYVVGNVLGGNRDESEDRVDIPSIVGCKFLCQDGDLQHQLFPDIEFCVG